MQKLRSILNPGSSNDDSVMYGEGDPNLGQLAGEGSHFAHDTTDQTHPVSAGPSTSAESSQGTSALNSGSNYDRDQSSTRRYDRMPGRFPSNDGDLPTTSTSATPLHSAITSNTTPVATIPEHNDRSSAVSSHNVPRESAVDTRQENVAPVGTGNLSNIAPSRATQDYETESQSKPAVSMLALRHAQQSGAQSTDRTDTIATERDPGTYARTSTATNPEQPSHHYGRDAALTGSAATAAGVSSYDQSNRGDHYEQPQSSDTTTTSSQPYTSSQQAQSTSSRGPSSAQTEEQEREHHYGRDATILGATGTASAGAYELSRDHHNQDHSSAIGTAVPMQAPQSTSTTETYAAPLWTHQFAPAPTSTSTRPQQVNYQDNSGLSTERGQDQISDYTSTAPRSSRADTSSQNEPQHHYGRDAAIGTGAAAAGAGAYALHQDRDIGRTSQSGRDAEPLTSSASESYRQPDLSNRETSTGTGFFSGPQGTAVHSHHHHANTSDSAYDEQRATPHAPHRDGRHDAAVGGIGGNLGTGSFGDSTGFNDSRTHEATRNEQSDHHYGRDAAIAGGAATAGGAGAYALANRDKVDQSSATSGTPSQSLNESYSSPSVGNLPTSDSTSGTTTGQSQAVADPTASSGSDNNHLGRDAGLAGGALAGGAGAYALSNREYEGLGRPVQSSNYQSVASPAAPTFQSDVSRTAYAAPIDARDESATGSHTGRNTALAGGAAVVGGAGAYELSKKEQEKHEIEQAKEAEKAQKQHQKELHEQEKHQQKEAAKAEKQHQKDLEHQEKEAKHKHEKEVAAAAAAAEAEKKKHQHEVEKEEKKHQHEVEKAEKQHEKEDKHEKKRREQEIAAAAAAAEAERKHREEETKKVEHERQKALESEKSKHDEEGKKKHGGILGFLHRDKDTKDESLTDSEVRDNNSHKKGAATAGVVGTGAGVAGYEALHHDRNETSQTPYSGQGASTSTTTTTTIGGGPTQTVTTGPRDYSHTTTTESPVHRSTYEQTPVDRVDENRYGTIGAAGVAGAGATYAATRERDEESIITADRSRGTTSTEGHHDQRRINRDSSADKDDKTKKRRSILGFLHHDKSQEAETRTSSTSTREARHDPNEIHAGHMGVDGPIGQAPTQHTGNAEGVGRHHSKLHKEPPAKVRQELEQKAEELRRRSYEENAGR